MLIDKEKQRINDAIINSRKTKAIGINESDNNLMRCKICLEVT